MSTKNIKIDKRQLFFDRNRKTYIEFDLEKTKTCEEIYNSLNKEIEQKITELYGDKNNKSFNFNFIMIYSRSNKLENTSNIEIKLDPTALLSDIMTNKQYFLCYLPPNEFNISLKKKVRNKFEEEENNFADRFKDVERDILSNHTIEKYLSNEGIYYFDKEKVEFFYGKGNVDEEKISINYKKINVPIIINEIKKEEYFENQIPPSIEVFKIKCPNYIFQIHQNNNTHFLGLYKYKSYLVWKNAINAAKIKNNNITIDSSFNVNIANYNTLLFVKSHSISSQCFIINQILQNFEKRQIFLDGYSDKKISDIINGIYSYKINIKNNKYFDAWVNFKQISFYIDFKNIEDEVQKKREIEKYSHVFTPERIELYNNVVEKVNNAIKKIKNYQEEINNVLKDIFEINLFDNLYYHLYELYIFPYFKKIKEILNREYRYEQKPDIVQKFHLLLSRYCVNFFDMKNIDNFNCLCSTNSNDNEIEYIETNSSNNLINMGINFNDISNKGNNNKKNNDIDKGKNQSEKDKSDKKNNDSDNDKNEKDKNDNGNNNNDNDKNNNNVSNSIDTTSPNESGLEKNVENKNNST